MTSLLVDILRFYFNRSGSHFQIENMIKSWLVQSKQLCKRRCAFPLGILCCSSRHPFPPRYLVFLNIENTSRALLQFLRFYNAPLLSGHLEEGRYSPIVKLYGTQMGPPLISEAPLISRHPISNFTIIEPYQSPLDWISKRFTINTSLTLSLLKPRARIIQWDSFFGCPSSIRRHFLLPSYH